MKIKLFLLFALLLANVMVPPVSSQIVATQEQNLGVGFTINFTESPVSMRDPAALKKIFDQTTEAGVVSTFQFDPFKMPSVANCFETKEAPSTVICVFNSQKTMNEVLLRASLYVETYPGVYITNEEFFSQDSLPQKTGMDGKPVTELDRHLIDFTLGNTGEYTGVKGYDLPGIAHESDGKGFNDFLDAWAKDKTVCTSADKKTQTYAAMERKYLNFVQSLRKKYNGKYILITTVANQLFMPAISHEFLHAQYFTFPKFAKNIDDYCASVENTPEFKLWENWAGRYYDMKITTLRNNEFMAFMLATGMYEDAKTRFAPVAAISLMHLVPPEKQTQKEKDFFREINALWQPGWKTYDEWNLLSKKSMEILSKYAADLPEHIDVMQSNFYKYLVKNGTQPVIVR